MLLLGISKEQFKALTADRQVIYLQKPWLLLLTSAVCSTFNKKLFLHRSNCKSICNSLKLMEFLAQYMNIDSFCLYSYERLNCPVAVSVSAVLHEATCHSKSEPLSAVSRLQRGCEVIPGKTALDLNAQAELMLFLYLADSKERHKDSKSFLPEVFISIQQIWQCYFIFFLLH